MEIDKENNEGRTSLTSSQDVTTKCFSYHEELSKLEDLGRALKDTQQRLNAASMKCHVLNVEMVTQFNPHQVEKLKNVIMDCEDCIERMEEILRKENSSS